MNEAWGVLAAVLSSGLGGTSVAATRYLVNAIDPLAIGSFRFGIGFLLLLPAAFLQGGRWPLRCDWSSVATTFLSLMSGFHITTSTKATASASNNDDTRLRVVTEADNGIIQLLTQGISQSV